jgi:hypothetical protein
MHRTVLDSCKPHVTFIEAIESVSLEQVESRVVLIDMHDQHTETVWSREHRICVVDVDLCLNEAAADHSNPCTLIGDLDGQDLVDGGGNSLFEKYLVRGLDPVDDQPDDGVVGTVHDREGVYEDVLAGQMTQNLA